MSELKESSLDVERRVRNSDIESNFRQRSVSQRRWWSIPRRYQVAMMCYLAFFIKDWMVCNLWTMFVHFFVATNEEREILFPGVGNWTVEKLELQLDLDHWGGIVAQFPAAALVFLYSPHKIMLLSILLSSLLHISIPSTIQGPEIVLYIIIFLQGIVAGPIACACISLWKEWAPTNERTSLLVLAFSGKLIQNYVTFSLSDFLARAAGPISPYYFAGITGFVWCFIWNTLIYESPSNDPLITIEEQCYLEQNVPAEYKEKIKLKAVPLKSILTSLPFLSLCLMFFVVPFLRGFMTLLNILNIINKHYDPEISHWMLAFNFIVVVPASGFLVDALINRRKCQILTLRKVFCSGGLVLHAIFLYLTIIPNQVIHVISYIFSYIFLSLSLTGYIPNILELSPRYACILIAICTTISRLSGIVFDLVGEAIYKEGELLIHGTMFEVLIPCGILGLITALLFAIFASSDEQLWSLSASLNRSPPKDARCYPKNDLEDDTLVSETL